jgi:DNA-binding GntR family transcriptional regulator
MDLTHVQDGWSRLGPLTLAEGATAQAQVYHRLRDAIISGYFRPGQEISLRRAAAVLGTSVTPIREALRQLESDGGLEVFGGNRVLRVPVLSDTELADIRDVRIKLEGFAAAQAIHAIGPPQMRLIFNACSIMQRAADTGDADMYLESNWRFHSLIYRAANRPVLMSVIEGMWLRVGPLIRLAVTAPFHFERSMDSHHAAVQALRDRNAEALQAAIVRDISDAAADLGQALVPQNRMASHAP